MSKIYVSDTNIWIDFEKANLLNEVFKLPFQFCCTDFVAAEISTITCQSLLKLGLIIETMDANDIKHLHTLMASHNNSSLADVSCYFLAQNNGLPLLTGDGKLRKRASKEGLTVRGSIWLLDLLIQHKIISEEAAATSLDTMRQQGARLPNIECQSRISNWRTKK
jgi:predicted nucleic acid-binding protein